jgi:hypothetical protein
VALGFTAQIAFSAPKLQLSDLILTVKIRNKNTLNKYALWQFIQGVFHDLSPKPMIPGKIFGQGFLYALRGGDQFHCLRI